MTEAGQAEKIAGMARAESGANPEWKRYAFACIVQLARARVDYTADDVFELLDQIGVVTHENRALGPVILKAAKAGVHAKTETYPTHRKTKRPWMHQGLEQIWVSLIYGSIAPIDNPYSED